MSLLSHWIAKPEINEQPYSAEVLCSNWVAPPPEQPATGDCTAARERLREADVVVFLARIYASQGC